MGYKNKSSTLIPRKGSLWVNLCQRQILLPSNRIASGSTLQLTTWLRCAAVFCLVDQLLPRLAAVGARHLRALNRLTLDAHGILVTHTFVAIAGPCVTRLVKRKNRFRHTAQALLVQMHVLYVPGISSHLFGLPIRPNTIWNSNRNKVCVKV